MLIFGLMVKKRILSSKVLAATGLSMPEFCDKHLNSKYKAFQYRVRTGRCNPNEIIFISWYLGESIKTLFGKPFTELMMRQGDLNVSKKAIELFKNAGKSEQKRLLGLLGSGFPLGASQDKTEPGASKYDGSRIPPYLEDEIGLISPLPSPEDGVPAVQARPKDKAQKKAPILNTTVEDLAPKDKTDPFDILQDFRISR